MSDFRLAVRTLSRTPGFAAAAILTLALGIGANAAIFSVVYGVLLRPLPYRQPSRLVLIEAWRDFSGRTTRANYSLADFEDLRRAEAFESMALAGTWSFGLALEGGTDVVAGAHVTPGFFETIGGSFVLGRPLSDADAHAPVAVISERLWQRRFGRSSDIVGRQVTLSGRSYTVVGVASSALQLPDARCDLWVPAATGAADRPRGIDRGSGGFNPVARLKPDVTLAQAQADLDRVSRSLATNFPRWFDRVRTNVVPLHDRIAGELRPALLILFAAVALVLIVACANVANLLLARQAARSREIAIRLALGASRVQLARMALAESAALSIGGVAIGGLVAQALTGLLLRLEPIGLTELDVVRIDGPVLAFAALAGIATTLLVGLLPALQSSSSADALKAGSTTLTAPPHSRRIRSAVAVLQVAASLVLVAGGLLLARSFVRLVGSEIGAATDHVAQALVGLSFGRTLTPPQRAIVADRLVERLSAEPGVVGAAASVSLPPNRSRLRVSFTLERQQGNDATNYLVDTVPVTPAFFNVLHVPLLRGRLFTSGDQADRPLVGIVSATAGRRLFGDRDPIGQTLPIGPPGADGRQRPVEIVGIVGDVKYAALEMPPDGAVYRPFPQMTLDSIFLVARTSTPPEAAVAAIRRSVAAVDRGVAIYSAGTLDGLVSDAAAQPRFRTFLLAVLAGLALTLAAVGLYGVVAFSTTQRAGEIAIRVALGAQPRDVVALLLREGVQLALAGVAIGLIAAYALARTLTALLYGVMPTDAWSFAGAAALLLAVMVVASYIPARRATRADPLVALRSN